MRHLGGCGSEPEVPTWKQLFLPVPSGYRGDRKANAKEMDDETDDGEPDVEARHADARKRQDYVLHEEVDHGAPDRSGQDEVAIQKGEHPREGEVHGGGAERDDEMADESEGGGFASARVGGLATQKSCGDALEQAHRRGRNDLAVNDEGGGDVATASYEACEEDRSGSGIGGGHVAQITPFRLDAEDRAASQALRCEDKNPFYLTEESCGRSLAGNCRGPHASFPLGRDHGIQTARLGNKAKEFLGTALRST